MSNPVQSTEEVSAPPPLANETKRRVSLPAAGGPSGEPEAKRIKLEPSTPSIAEAAAGVPVANGQVVVVPKPPAPVQTAPTAISVPVAANPIPTGTIIIKAEAAIIQCKQEPGAAASSPVPAFLPAATAAAPPVVLQPTAAAAVPPVALQPAAPAPAAKPIIQSVVPQNGQLVAHTPVAATAPAVLGSTVSPNPVGLKTKVSNGSTASGLTKATDATSTAAAPTPTAAIPVQVAAAAAPQAPPPPLKALRMSHLRTKYTGELEYMLREFRKLERQLLGAKGATQIEESAGSRERREKLHSFILHLEDTIRQIELGCKLESEGKSTVNVGVAGPDQQGNSNGLAATAAVTAAAQEQAKRDRADSSALTNLTQEKEEEENVQKLEEHILANLLPVKVRLKKQLAAQQGATKNPATMPAMRRGSLPAEGDRGKGTFAAAADQRRKEAEALAAAQQHVPAEPVHPDNTHFGKPLGQRGSSLTQKLHGQTLGSKGRTHGHGVGLSKPATEEGKIVYGGVAPGSKQVASGVAVASAVHSMVIDSSQLQNGRAASPGKPIVNAIKSESLQTAAVAVAVAVAPSVPTVVPVAAVTTATKPPVPEKARIAQHPKAVASKPAPQPPTHIKAPKGSPDMVPSAATKAIREKLDDPTLPDDERKKLRRKLKKKLLIRRAKRREFERQRQVVLQHSAQAIPKAGVGRKKILGGKVNGKKRGPRSVEYICSLCSEAYSSVCEFNPWWALAQHECPKCRKPQIPRVDISSPANAIEYHPALLAHADDNGASAAAAAAAVAAAEQAAPAQMPSPKYPLSSLHAMSGGSDSEFGSDLSDITDGNLSDISLDSDDSDADVLASLTPAEKAEYERFGAEYKGPKLADSEASRLLILMLHANGCPCRHKNRKQRDVCRSTKFMMLHVRDCHGTTSNFDVCPFPWCRKVKHLLYHLVSCNEPLTCSICSPVDLPEGMVGLVGLNTHRLKRQRDRMIATYKARQQQQLKMQSQPTKPTPVAPTNKKPTTPRMQHPGAPAIKPKAVAIRTKAKSPAQVAPRVTKPTKPAVTVVRKPITGPAGVTVAMTKPFNGKPAAARPVASKPATVYPVPTPVVATATATQASAVPKALIPIQTMVQNPVPLPAKPAAQLAVPQSIPVAPLVAPAKAPLVPVAQALPVPVLSPMTTVAPAAQATPVVAPPVIGAASTIAPVNAVPTATTIITTATLPGTSKVVPISGPSLVAAPIRAGPPPTVAPAAIAATNQKANILPPALVATSPAVITKVAPQAPVQPLTTAAATTKTEPSHFYPIALSAKVKQEIVPGRAALPAPPKSVVAAELKAAVPQGLPIKVAGPIVKLEEGVTVVAQPTIPKIAVTNSSIAVSMKLEAGKATSVMEAAKKSSEGQPSIPQPAAAGQEGSTTPVSPDVSSNCPKEGIAKPGKEPIKSF